MNAIFQCAVHLANGVVLQTGNVSASRDRLIDWRTVKSGYWCTLGFRAGEWVTFV